jgi:hypothetical protein
MMLKLTSEVHFAIILFEEDDLGSRHLEDLEISCKLSLRLDCYKCNLHKSKVYKKFAACRDPPNDIVFFNGGWGIPSLKEKSFTIKKPTLSSSEMKSSISGSETPFLEAVT